MLVSDLVDKVSHLRMDGCEKLWHHVDHNWIFWHTSVQAWRCPLSFLSLFGPWRCVAFPRREWNIFALTVVIVLTNIIFEWGRSWGCGLIIFLIHQIVHHIVDSYLNLVGLLTRSTIFTKYNHPIIIIRPRFVAHVACLRVALQNFNCYILPFMFMLRI